MKKFLITTAFLFIFCGVSYSQTQPDTVVIPRAVLNKCLEDSDKVTAQRAELDVKDKAIDELKAELSRIKAELALQTGKNIVLESTLIRQNTILELAIRNTREKNFALIKF